MKKFMTLLTMITLVGCLVFTTSCKKNEEDIPSPADTTNTGGNGNGGNGGNTGNGGTTYIPSVTVSTNGTLIAPANVDINATITNLVADSIAKVELLDVNNTVIATLTTSPFSFSRTALTAGDYTYLVKATAVNGITTTKTVSFTVVAPNGAPTFTATDLGQLTSSTTTYNANVSGIVSDPENNTITVTSATTTTNGVTVTNVSGTSFDIVVPNTKYAGQITLSVTISDGTNSTTSNVTVKIGTTAQATTYGIMSSFLNRTLSPSNPSGLRFNSTGTVSTGVNNVNFWGGSCTNGTWSINSDGTLTISNSCNNGTNTYTVTLNSGYLTLTNTVNTSYVWYGL
jgi:hypothetical protein